MFEAAIGTAITFILLFSWIGFKKIAGIAPIIDVAVFLLMIFLFHGTYAGIMTGIIAGLIVTAFLRIIRRCVTPEKLRLRRKNGELVPRLRWEEIRPR